MSTNKQKNRRKFDRKNTFTLVALAVVLVVAVVISTPLGERITQGLDIRGGLSVILSATHGDGAEVTQDEMDTAIAVVENRVNKLGASEATVQQQGDSSILVQIPGVEDSEAALSIIGTTGVLEFVDLRDITDEDVVERIESYETNFEIDPSCYTAFMTAESIDKVSVGQESEGSAYYAVNLDLDSAGTKAFATVSEELVSTHGKIAILLDGVLQSAPAVQSAILTGDVAITGNYTLTEANALKTVLESGSLPVTLSFSESRVVGPTLGQDSLRAGLIAVLAGFAIVLLYLIFFYRGLGIITAANMFVFAILYLGTLAALSFFGLFALSLAGLAGIVLTIGMAADSSILVLERFKEEMRMGRSVKTASISGVRHAIGTSIDADLVSLVSALALFFIAVGQVKGFGMTLALGIIIDIVTMLAFKAPVIRLLAPKVMARSTGFWGIKEDLEAGAAAEAVALEKGARRG